MVDKKTESDIKALKVFLELWAKFHALYVSALSKEVISDEDEKKFLEAKNVIGAKYRSLNDVMEFKYMPHARLDDPVGEVLKIEAIKFISEKNMRKLEADWKDSYIFLNSILERLESKRMRLEAFNPIGVFFKRIMERI